jgi:hypothetical protein
MSISLRSSFLLVFLRFAFATQTFQSPQNSHAPELPMWKEARSAAAKGTLIPVPKLILDELTAHPDDCGGPIRGKTTDLDAYSVRNGRSFLVAVWGRGNCFCGATGNCRFWVYRFQHGEYAVLLATDMVNDFGFLRASTKGARNLITWEHGGAFSSPALHFVYNGDHYESDCGWEEKYKGHQSPGGGWEWEPEPNFEYNTCTNDINLE